MWLYAYVSVPACLHVYHMCMNTQAGWKRKSDILELNYYYTSYEPPSVGAGTQTWALSKSTECS